MSLALLALLFIAVLAAGYVLYGRFVARQFGLDPEAKTPSHEVNDGVDYVPTKPFYLMGQHFSAIAAAGPIVGPIAACLYFGWMPCLLWIGLGVVFIGAVHDFSALVASVRHKGQTIAEIVKQNLSPRAWIAFLVFIWIALIYVIVAFADVTAAQFVGILKEPGVEGEVTFNKGGAVAAASILYLLLAVVMGVIQKKFDPKLWIMTVIFVPATIGMVWLGEVVGAGLILDQKTWSIGILGYCFVASILPAWVLLQPRGYLGGFVLYMALAIGVFGIFFGGNSIHPDQVQFKGWEVAGKADGLLFPFLFVTIACGACSGFHGLVSSGTTSKQIEREPHCRPIGFGGMLLEAFVALIALATIMVASSAEIKGKGPGDIYGAGIGKFLRQMTGVGRYFAITFGSMVFSTFVFDTIDVSTRLGRMILQELFSLKGRAGMLIATSLTVLPPVVLLYMAPPGSWRWFWTLFGTSNQLLAALTLLGISVWLFRNGKPMWFTLLPMMFVMTITLWSLVLHITPWLSAVQVTGVMTANGIVSIVLIALAVVLVVEAILAARRHLLKVSI